MSWDYRVIKRFETGVPYYRDDIALAQTEISFKIHEVFYDDEDFDGWTISPMSPSGESVEELAEELRLMAEALKLPVLVEDGDKLKEA